MFHMSRCAHANANTRQTYTRYIQCVTRKGAKGSEIDRKVTLITSVTQCERTAADSATINCSIDPPKNAKIASYSKLLTVTTRLFLPQYETTHKIKISRAESRRQPKLQHALDRRLEPTHALCIMVIRVLCDSKCSENTRERSRE